MWLALRAQCLIGAVGQLYPDMKSPQVLGMLQSGLSVRFAASRRSALGREIAIAACARMGS